MRIGFFGTNRNTPRSAASMKARRAVRLAKRRNAADREHMRQLADARFGPLDKL